MEVAVLASPSPISLIVSVHVKQHKRKKEVKLFLRQIVSEAVLSVLPGGGGIRKRQIPTPSLLERFLL